MKLPADLILSDSLNLDMTSSSFMAAFAQHQAAWTAKVLATFSQSH